MPYTNGVRGALARLGCRVFGHRWRVLPTAVPEDRETYRCTRCGLFAHVPPSFDEPYLSDAERDAAHRRGER